MDVRSVEAHVRGFVNAGEVNSGDVDSGAGVAEYLEGASTGGGGWVADGLDLGQAGHDVDDTRVDDRREAAVQGQVQQLDAQAGGVAVLIVHQREDEDDGAAEQPARAECEDAVAHGLGQRRRGDGGGGVRRRRRRRRPFLDDSHAQPCKPERAQHRHPAHGAADPLEQLE